MVKRLFTYFFIGCFLSSCSTKIVMFQPTDETVSKAFKNADPHFTIQPNDRLELQVFSNGGEKIVDAQSTAPVSTAQQPAEKLLFPVDSAGMVTFPLIGKVKVSGMLLPEAEQSLKAAYSTFYKDPFVKLNFANKRVVVLGAFGNKVIPLQNQNMRLTEVLALTDAATNLGKVNKIRILRGEGYFIADLSTLHDFAKNDVTIEPNDIIYVEPTSRKPIREAIRDYGPIASFLTAITTLIVLIQTN